MTATVSGLPPILLCGIVFLNLVHTCACEDLNNSTPSTSLGGDQTKRNPQFKATLNAHGHMLDVLDEYGEAFVAFARNTTNPVADLGVAFGFSTKEILKTGATVYANDLSEDMLKELNDSLTEEERLRCILKPGNALELDFEPGSLSGVLALRWFHFLTGPEIREVVHKFFTWLEPGGKVVITCSTPYSGRARSFIPEYEERKAAGEEWPGFTTKQIQEVGGVGSREHFHKLEPFIFERELKAAGFEVEKCGFIARTFYPEGWQFDGREHCGVVGVKTRQISTPN